jgi:hypothetical protein
MLSSVKVMPQQAKVAQVVPGRLMSRIFLTLGTTRMVGEIHGTHFSEAESTPGHMVPSGVTEKIPSDSTGNQFRDFPTSSAVP